MDTSFLPRGLSGQQRSTRTRAQPERPSTTDLAPALRARSFLRGRTLTSGSNAALALATARSQHAEMASEQRARLKTHSEISALGAAWQPLGPAQIQSLSYGAVSGRVTSIAVDPSDASGNTVYVGATGGGVWKSTNAAGTTASVSFTPLTDTLPVFSGNAGSAATASLSIGALSAQAGGIVLAGTGDPNDSSDSYYGTGILRSADGGVTWSLIAGSRDGLYGNHSFMGLGFAGFAWSTATPTLVVAAVSQSVEGVLVNALDATSSVMGLYYSADAGATWQMATITDGSHVIQSPLPNGGNNGGHAATAVVWNPVRQRFYAAVRYHGYYESADGMTWTRLAAQPSAGLTTTACPPAIGVAGAASCPIFRGALAVQPATGDTFALTVDAGNHDGGLVQDVCGLAGGSHCSTPEPAFGTQILSSPLDSTDGSGTIAQGDYNLTLYAAATASDTVLFVGTHDLFRCSVAAGCVLRNTTNTANGCNAPAHVAPAQHAVTGSAGGSPPVIFFGNDGGLWRSADLVNQQASVCSDDDAAHFQNLNGALGSIAEVVSFAQDPVDPSVVLTGDGAAGTAASDSGGWLQLSAGEGGTVAIDPLHPALWYLSTAAGISIQQCAVGAACTPGDVSGPATIGPAAVGLDDARLDAPWLLDPNDPTQLIAGTCRVWRGPAANGGAWTGGNVLGPMFSGPQGPACTTTANPLVRSLAAGGVSSTSTVAPVMYAGIAGLLGGGGTIAGHVFGVANSTHASEMTTWTDLAASPVTNDFSNRQVFNVGGFDVSSITVDPHDPTGQTIYITVMGFAGNGVSAAHLYRSVDRGAHWLNLSSNLPNAPANSVAVDPNDANTVYVALDTGVYVTQAITGCASTNCWTVYGAVLPNAPVIQLAAAARMPTGDGRVGELRAATAGRGVWQIPLVTALAVSRPLMSVSPAALVFATEPVGDLGSSQVVTVTNVGAASLVLSSIAAAGDFEAASECLNSGIVPGASCVVQVQFLPTATGARTGQLTIYGNVQGGQATVALSGTATPAATVVLNPIVLPFPTTSVGASSYTQNITVSNTAGAVATIGTPAVSGDFALTANTCGSSLPSSTGCTVAILFSPRAAGTRSGLFTISTSAGVLTAALSGSGTAPATDTLSATQLSFATQQTGSSSAAQTIVLTNAGDAALTLVSARVAAGAFSVVNGCGNSLNGHASCALSVLFGPSTIGPQTGSLVISDEFRSQTITLAGTGIAPAGISLSPAGSLSFASTAVGASSTTQTVVLTNNGGAALTIASATVTGDFALASGSACAGTVQPGANCPMAILFAPTATGLRSGTLTVVDNTATSPHVLSLSGTGIDFSITADGQTSATISNGASAAFPLLVSSDAGVSGPAIVQCSGMPANSTCSLSPATVSLGSTTLVVATVRAGVASPANAKLDQLEDRGLWLAMVLPGMFLLSRRSRFRISPGLLVLLLALTGLTGCGASRAMPGAATDNTTQSSVPVSTPAGTYTITVTVTSAGLMRNVAFSLTVQ